MHREHLSSEGPRKERLFFDIFFNLLRVVTLLFSPSFRIRGFCPCPLFPSPAGLTVQSQVLGGEPLLSSVRVLCFVRNTRALIEILIRSSTHKDGQGGKASV